MTVVPAEQSLGIVLRRFEFGESSQTGRIYTRDFGRVPVIAKGIKRGGPELRGPMDLFALAEVAFRRQRSAELRLLVRYRVVTGFPGLRRNLERLFGAYYVAEILYEGTRDEVPEPELFDLVIDVLVALESAASHQVFLLAAYFVLHFLDRSGFSPMLDACVRCGRTAPESGSVRVSVDRGGLVCRLCVAGRPHDLVTLKAGTRSFLRALRASEDATSVLSMHANEEDRLGARHLLGHLIESVLERELRSGMFLPM